MLIPHKGHTDTIQVYSVTVMTHVKAWQAGHSSQGTSEPITPALISPSHALHKAGRTFPDFASWRTSIYDVINFGCVIMRIQLNI